MKVMVFSVNAESGGALSILNDFYEEVKHLNNNIEWIFVVSKATLNNTHNIKVLQYEWTKKSWLHRLYFEHFVAPKIVKEYQVEKVFTFHNILIKKIKVPQILYLHQAIPFSDMKFNIFSERTLWLYKNILSYSIFSSIKKANKVIVQTNWMKEACIRKLNIEKSKINVVPPALNFNKREKEIISEVSFKRDYNIYFYPASAQRYKNHNVIFEAAKILKSREVDFKIYLTLNSEGNEKLVKDVEKYNLPIIFLGNLKREQVLLLYKKTTLIFPSYLETFGLPLLEAKLSKAPIIASKMPFSLEILDDYSRVAFFDVNNPYELADIIEKQKWRENNFKSESSEVAVKKLSDYII